VAPNMLLAEKTPLTLGYSHHLVAVSPKIICTISSKIVKTRWVLDKEVSLVRKGNEG
jgi:hypothetical protein